MKYFIGPVSKNTIDAVIDYSKTYNVDFVFIPSRRQIEYNGGYVENFTTKQFISYIKSKNTNILIERDHSGPGQGFIDDDGFESLKEDCKYFNIIHIDPWKKYPNFDDAVEWTVKLINYCYSLNKDILYEIGTEEGIRPIDSDELDRFIQEVKLKLLPEVFLKIKYLVIQCGTKLLEQTNIGTYDSKKLDRMLEISNKYNLIAKEHNGDWVSYDIIKEKEKQGLTCINIAPEFGEIESSVIINRFKENPQDLEEFFTLCYKSDTWKKWVSNDFDPFNNKEKLIKICGHYNYANPVFMSLKNKYKDIDNDICKAIKYKLMELLGVYTVRTHCIICKSNKLDTYFSNDFETPCSFSLYNSIKESAISIPHNILSCKECKTVQTKYLGNLSIIYGNNHVDSFGKTKNDTNIKFANFILNNNINSIIEVGACNDSLAQLILERKYIPYTIIDADYKGEVNKNISIINNFIENIDLDKVKGDTLILSYIFEHIYDPISFLEKIQKSNSIKQIYFNHPDFEYFSRNNIYNILNVEHIFYIEKKLLINLLYNHNFILEREYNYNNHSMFLKFIRSDTCNNNLEIINKSSIEDINTYICNMHKKIGILNNIISTNIRKKYYIWPASAHTITLFVNGLDYTKLDGILDNSPNKIGKFLYKYNLECFSFDNILKNKDEDSVIILGGLGNYINELDIDSTKIIKFTEL